MPRKMRTQESPVHCVLLHNAELNIFNSKIPSHSHLNAKITIHICSNGICMGRGNRGRKGDSGLTVLAGMMHT